MDRTTALQRTPERATGGSIRLDPGQQAVVEHRGGPLLVLGAAGTGKTTALVETAVSRVRDRGIDAGRVLVLTFSRGATRVLAERIADRLGHTGAAVPVLSIHGFCHAVHAEADRTDPWRVLTAPEQELRLREILAASAGTWQALDEAIGTRAFTRELRDLVARARQLGLDPDDIGRFGRSDGRPEWVRAAALFEEYLDVLDAERVVDYDELVHRVRILLADPATGDPLRSRWSTVLVDDLQDAVPAHAELLRSLAPPGGPVELVATANPDQAVYAFRGADAGAVAEFPARFADAQGRGAPVRLLGSDHRHGPALARVVHAPTARMAQPVTLPTWRAPQSARDEESPGHPGTATYLECADARQEAAAVARALVAGHEEHGYPWHRMAVVVRSRGPAEAVLRRRLQRAGVPVAVPDDTALVEETSVQVLLDVVTVALGLSEAEPETHERLALGPLGAIDPMDLRRHRRLLAAGSEGLSVVRARLAAVDKAIAETRTSIEDGGSAEEVLWAAWAATDWPTRLRETALGSGQEADRADRDLDAVVALFDFAGRSGARRGRAAAEELLDEVGHQEIAADSRTTRRLRRDAVEVATAHRCGGREWDLVVVAGVQEGTWPAVRRRHSLLAADRLGPDGATPPPTAGEALAEERRLFHQALARARDVLVVTAVSDPAAEVGPPSRFVAELGLATTRFDPAEHPIPSAAALVGELRGVGADAAAGPLLRERAAVALARLSEDVAAARPRHWWAARTRTECPEPLTGADEPIRLSGSSVDMLRTCPRRWFLERRAGGARTVSEHSAVGNLVHRLAQESSRGETDLPGLRARFDAAWGEVPAGPAWRDAARKERVWSMVEAWWTWQADRPADQLVGVEVPFSCELEVVRPDGLPDRVLLTGVVDRLELVDDSLVVVDYKTGRRATAREVETMGQLGAYQAAVLAGSFDDVTGQAIRRPGKALAVYLDAGEGTPKAKDLIQPSVIDVPVPEGIDVGPAADWVTAALGEAAQIVRNEEFSARRGTHCRGCLFAADCTVRGGQL
ncbi:Superfamily I DNA or RNA helicase [Raineyella antarctica]|uniref:DNA 3'-5' helicase n=1 Tax=Raineyella antarctica TaxID=1577474 RepID=A0A1G6GWC1_9ACTN|nr:ATP-dependent DNA helicase [Raineyella antarctica]SDB85955.1 Superfamily I DNA or RNA helicase [Raineyella antarctica]